MALTASHSDNAHRATIAQTAARMAIPSPTTNTIVCQPSDQHAKTNQPAKIDQAITFMVLSLIAQRQDGIPELGREMARELSGVEVDDLNHFAFLDRQL